MLLNALIAAPFADRFFAVATVEAWYSILARSEEVKNLRQGLSTNAVTEGSLGDFVSGITEDFESGHKFVHEAALAAIAVALEDNPASYATEYLTGLANLKIAEIPMAIRVARLVLAQQISR